MSPHRTLLAAALASTLVLSVAACSREAGDTATNAAAPDAPADPADMVSPAADPSAGTPTGAMPPEATVDPAAPAAGACNADAVQSLVGQTSTDALVEQAQRDSGSASVRVLRPGDAATMDYREDRLNIELDDAGAIVSLRCG